MNVSIYLVMEEGMTKPYVSTTPPTAYKKPQDKQAKVFRVDVEVPDFMSVDGVLTPERMTP